MAKKKSNSNDVIISTRVRIVRNLADFPFPVKMNEDDRERTKALIYDAFSVDSAFHMLKAKQISQDGQQLLRAQGAISDRDFDAVILKDDDESVSALINETDHLKLAATAEGLDCETAMKKVYKIDELLQNKLQFAASAEFGYLSSRIKDCGSGMKTSLRLFIPSIILSNSFDSLASMVKEKSLALRPVFKKKEIGEFSNWLFELSTGSSFEGTELDQMALMQSVGEVILKTERKIRPKFADNNPTIVLNFLKQGYSMAMYSLLLSYESAVAIICAVKYALQLEMIGGINERDLNRLFLRVTDGHLKYLINNFSFSFDEDIRHDEKLKLKRLRAIVIQQAFEGIDHEKSVS